jgi:NAD-dependent dihydropyrimidine dehydrogenase PreA subunit
MAHFIGNSCIDVLDRTCIEVCPVDCIYEGSRKLYIHPTECIDCGACLVECPVDAIQVDWKASADEQPSVADNAAFFEEVLPGRDAPLGDPGSATELGPVGVDTPFVSAFESAV